MSSYITVGKYSHSEKEEASYKTTHILAVQPGSCTPEQLNQKNENLPPKNPM